MDKDRLHQKLLIPFALLALGLRILALTWQPLWWDEGYSLYASTMPIGQMIAETAGDIHPPLYYVLLHIWGALIGNTPGSIRLFSVFLGVLVPLVSFQLAKHLGGYRLAWLAGLITALNPFLISYSQEVRMYILTSLLGLLSTYLMFRWLEKQVHLQQKSSHFLLAGYLVITAAALYTHYYSIFIPLAQSLFIVIYYRDRIPLLKWFIGQIVLAILYLPWIIFTIAKLTSYIGGKVSIEQSIPLGPIEFLWEHLAAFTLGHLPDHWSPLYWVSIVFLVIAILGVIKTRAVTVRQPEAFFWPVLILVSLAGAYLINLIYPFHPHGFQRLLSFAAPGYYFLLAMGCLYLWRKAKLAAGIILIALVTANGLAIWTFYMTPRNVDDDYRPLISQVKFGAQPGDVVLNLYPWQIGYFHSYYGPDRPALEPAFEQDWLSRQDNPDMLANYINDLMSQYDRVWFPAHQIGGRILENELEAYLANHYHAITSQWANPHTRLFLFSKAGDLVHSESAINFGNHVRLVGYGLNRAPVSTGGGTVTVELDWQLMTELQEPYYVGLRLAGFTGYTWAQRSAEPLAGLKPFGEWSVGEIVHDRHGLLVSADAPPGKYHVKVGIYRRSDGRGLDILNPAGMPQGVEADLGIVDVRLAQKPPANNRLPIPYPHSVDLRNSEEEVVRFLGYSLLNTDYVPGSELPVVLFWKPLSEMSEDNQVVLQIVDESGQKVIEEQRPVVFGYYPMSQWEPNYPVRDPHRIVVPPETPPGKYIIRIGLLHQQSKQLFSKNHSNQSFIELQEINIKEGRPHNFDPPDIPHNLEARWQGKIQLLGYGDFPDSIKRGQTVNLTLYWKALDTMQTSYTVFVHLLDRHQMIQGQTDSIPGKGTLPTTGWIPGEYLSDTYTFQVAQDAPEGPYRLEIGIYDAASGIRLPVNLEGSGETQDRILLPINISLVAKKTEQ